MIDEILPGIYRIEVPLPNSPLESVNAYLLKGRPGKEKDLLVDTGMNKKECRLALLSALEELGADLENINIFITHMHHDHFGLAMSLLPEEGAIYMNPLDAAFLRDLPQQEKDYLYAQTNGFPVSELREALKKRDDFLQSLPLEELNRALKGNSSPEGFATKPFHFIKGGERFKVGEYILQPLMTPGHSRGHLCLYEPRCRLLFSGDHLLEDITPAVFLWPGEKGNPLREYLNSLDKVFALDIAAVLPGHRGVFREYRERISALKDHHLRRSEVMASLLDGTGKNAYQIAAQASWNVPLSWEEFTPELKWMALAETAAHLKYMEEEGWIKSEIREDNTKYYYLLK